MCGLQYPWIFEEYAKQQGWSEELTTDEFAPYCKEYYERAVKIINNIYPFREEDRKKLGGPEMAKDFYFCVNASISCGCMTDDAYDELVKFVDDLDKLDEETSLMISFIFDIFHELYTYYLGEDPLGSNEAFD